MFHIQIDSHNKLEEHIQKVSKVATGPSNKNPFGQLTMPAKSLEWRRDIQHLGKHYMGRSSEPWSREMRPIKLMKKWTPPILKHSLSLPFHEEAAPRESLLLS